MNGFTFFATLTACLLVVLVALGSGVVLYLSDEKLRLWMPRLIALAIGVLLGDAFLHLLPEAMERSEKPTTLFLWTLLGVLGFYGIEQWLHWKHDHAVMLMDTERGKESAEQQTKASYATMNLLGDGIHNLVDGILIAGSFLTDPVLGVTTTIAIVLHEIPQEFSDIAVLIHGGFGKREAVLANVLCACTCILGAALTLAASQLVSLSLEALLAVTAGGFIYIAMTDLIPLLRGGEMKLGMSGHVTATAAGVIFMQALLWLEGTPH